MRIKREFFRFKLVRCWWNHRRTWVHVDKSLAQELHKHCTKIAQKIALELHKPFDQALDASTVHYAVHVVAIYIICNSEFMDLFKFKYLECQHICCWIYFAFCFMFLWECMMIFWNIREYLWIYHGSAWCCTFLWETRTVSPEWGKSTKLTQILENLSWKWNSKIQFNLFFQKFYMANLMKL